MIITISGQPGSGKSTTAKGLAEKLNLNHYSVGDYRRKKAEEKGMTINEYNKFGEKDFSTDKEADEWQKSLAKQNNFIIDGRLSFYFIKNSVKVFLKANKYKTAERIMKEKRKDESFSNIAEAVKCIEERQKSDTMRYKNYYDLDPYDEKHYDIVMDTTNMTIQETVERVAEEIANFK